MYQPFPDLQVEVNEMIAEEHQRAHQQTHGFPWIR